MPESPKNSLPVLPDLLAPFVRVCDDYIAAIERIGKQVIERPSTAAASRIFHYFGALVSLCLSAPPCTSGPPHSVMLIRNSGG